ncbi:MAG TPA: winged helix-turn-helix domain-containing protein [Nitrososphaerales archaeon]|nr:winged helix-turn-helix domain-containing protein [Nitrososphaerales archaeon]
MELRMDILTVVRDGAEGPTQIMFKANLSWKLLTQHLKELVGNGILSEHSLKNRLFYRLTDKGISILRSYLNVADQFNLIDRYGSHSEQQGQRQDDFHPLGSV